MFATTLAHNPVLEADCAESLANIRAGLDATPGGFEALPLVVEGNSKIVRRLSSSVVLLKLKPTVYSYTHNRSGEAPGTDEVRARFTAAIYDRMTVELAPAFARQIHAFIGLIDTPAGSLLAQRETDTCNLEVRVKRFHIGSPLHRYRGTENYPSTQSCEPITRWSRFETPVVCFDWRHPMFDTEGNRLADEPLSDDYAALWMSDMPSAKNLARETFLWLENVMQRAGIVLIDICFFIDRSGQLLYGEISPDCMRARLGDGNVSNLTSVDKDVWRYGLSPQQLLQRYEIFYERLIKLGDMT